MRYSIYIELDTNGQYLVTFPDIPEAVTAADTEEQAFIMVVDALKSALDFYSDQNRLLPPPSKLMPGQPSVDFPISSSKGFPRKPVGFKKAR